VKIGRFVITRVRRTPAGLDIYPWQALTKDRVTPELRQIIAKVARSEVKSFLEEMRETAGTPSSGCVASHCVEGGHIYVTGDK